MAEPAHIIPMTANADAVIGGDFAMTIELFADEHTTEPADLSKCTFTMTIGDMFTLTKGDGLTIKPGVVRALLTAEQTGSVVYVPPAAIHSFELCVEEDGFTVFPVVGDIAFRPASAYRRR